MRALRALTPWCVFSMLVPSIGASEGINLAWDECGASGTSNRSFACDTNLGANTLVASFDPPAGVMKLVGCSAVIDLGVKVAEPSPWWQFDAGGCRADALELVLTAPTTFTCADYWSGAATGSLVYLPSFGGNPVRSRFLVSFGIPEALAGPVEAGTEYYAFRLVLANSGAMGPEACAGCSAPACLVLSSLWLYQPSGVGDHALCAPRDYLMVSWQGGAVGGLGCPPADGPPWWPDDCLATPTRGATWGLVKSLYR